MARDATSPSPSPGCSSSAAKQPPRSMSGTGPATPGWTNALGSIQAVIGWSMENGFFDVGVVASYSGVGRGWEKKRAARHRRQSASAGL